MTNQAANWPTLSLALERDPEGVICISLVMQDRQNVRREQVPASLFGLDGRLDAAKHGRVAIEQTCLQQSDAEWTERLLGNVSERKARPSGVWLDMGPGSQVLAALPWSGLLRPFRLLPVFRNTWPGLPALRRQPAAVVVCMSSVAGDHAFTIGPAWDTLAVWLQSFSLYRYRIELFVDQAAIAELEGRIRAHKSLRHNTTLHRVEPDALPPHKDVPSAPKNDSSENPWFDWMRRVLARRAVQSVHFVANGYFTGTAGALVLASSPVPAGGERGAILVGASELGLFLDEIGAPAVSLSVAHGDASAIGARLLADGVRRVRPGAIAVSRIGDDEHSPAPLLHPYLRPAQLGDRLRQDAMLWRAQTLFAHPADVLAPAFHSDGDLKMPHLHERCEALRESGAPVPAWQERGLLSMARAAFELNNIAISDDLDRAQRAGRQRAQNFVADVIAGPVRPAGRTPQNHKLKPLR